MDEHSRHARSRRDGDRYRRWRRAALVVGTAGALVLPAASAWASPWQRTDPVPDQGVRSVSVSQCPGYGGRGDGGPGYGGPGYGGPGDGGPGWDGPQDLAGGPWEYLDGRPWGVPGEFPGQFPGDFPGDFPGEFPGGPQGGGCHQSSSSTGPDGSTSWSESWSW